ncbi:MAG TPA: hypothetical protein VIN02_04480, partial [Sulfurovum sp.]
DENFTPKKDFYANPNASDGSNESPVEHYYETNFIVKDENGHDKVDVNIRLFPGSQEKNNAQNKKPTILDVKGGEL